MAPEIARLIHRMQAEVLDRGLPSAEESALLDRLDEIARPALAALGWTLGGEQDDAGVLTAPDGTRWGLDAEDLYQIEGE